MGQRERDEELARITKNTDEPVFAIPLSTEPIRAQVVSDSRDTLPRRVALLAFILIIFLMIALAWQQARDNHRATDNAIAAVKAVKDQIKPLKKSNKQLLQGLEAQRKFDRELRKVLIEQNKRLAAAGLPTSTVPAYPSQGGNTGQRGPRGRQGPSGRDGHNPSPTPAPSNSPKPSKSPTPTCSPLPVIDRCVTLPPAIGGNGVPPTKRASSTAQSSSGSSGGQPWEATAAVAILLDGYAIARFTRRRPLQQGARLGAPSQRRVRRVRPDDGGEQPTARHGVPHRHRAASH